MHKSVGFAQRSKTFHAGAYHETEKHKKSITSRAIGPASLQNEHENVALDVLALVVSSTKSRRRPILPGAGLPPTVSASFLRYPLSPLPSLF